MVYILKFQQPIGTDKHSARYYIGYCADDRFNARMRHHANGTGARLTAVAAERGITFEVIAIFEGKGRDFERQLKNRKNTPKLVEQLKRQGVI